MCSKNCAFSLWLFGCGYLHNLAFGMVFLKGVFAVYPMTLKTGQPKSL